MSISSGINAEYGSIPPCSIRINLNEKYDAKMWKLVPKTNFLANLTPPEGLKPDDYFAFIPSYVGSVFPGKPLSWSTSCFKSNSATLTISANQSASLVVSTTEKRSLLCRDGYLIAYVGSLDVRYFELSWFDHHITWPGGWSDGELYDLNVNGLRIFKFPDGIIATVEELFETVMLFFGGLIGAHVPEWTAEDNLKFLEDHMGLKMEERKIQRVDIDKSEVKSGDFLGIIRLDGLDPMLAWAMGSHTGHTTITMWMDGELYVCESTVKSSYWPTNGVQCTLWDEWLDLAEKANYNVVHLPLDPEVAKLFSSSDAIKFFKSVAGLPYGFHNQFTGWVDTPEDNFPGNLSSHLAQLLAPFGDWLLRQELGLGQTFDFIRQGFNKRLGTEGLSIVDLYMYASKKGISFTTLATMPELDEWIFTNDPGTPSGPSMVCDVFVMRMWKAGGIFGNITDLIQAAEFTNWDAYSLKIFDSNYVRPAACVEADPTSQFCQLLGKYRMTLPNYNTFVPYPHMRERCPSKPPLYKKPLGC
eukprot:TRINITY_DN7645_c0_g1_i1.p1 TRINITY_DN7645_c0_g1~~TRINITY_DN7645_c0_g1_i1.p1  ORF type:complete len:529 (-),score=93.89 TRINITY_DN7645_c0_g1_i1:153-1739(-)